MCYDNNVSSYGKFGKEKKKRTERSAKRNWNAEQHHTEY